MTRSLPKLAGFAVVLAVLFGGGALAGALIDPNSPGGRSAAATDSHGMHESSAPAAVRGLAVAEHGQRLVLETPELGQARPATLRFRISDEHDRATRDFDVVHTKRMHLIVVRRDLTGFQHLHPTQAPDGSWSTPISLADAGSYRVFADFSHAGEATTLATDLRVDGPADLSALPAAATTATSDGGYRVALDAGHARAGKEADLCFSVTKDGRPVDTQPYLGAGGHLVSLRDGDLAFLHVHPSDDQPDGRICFMSTFPSEGRYGLFLQFQVAGQVQTVAFTQEVGR
jgi:hypothetical protein